VAGISGDGVRFHGFLPLKGRRRGEVLAAIGTERALSVIYESPRRIGQTLKDLAERSGSRRCVVLRELTKAHEQILRGTVIELAAEHTTEVRGEITLLVEGARAGDKSDLADERLREIIRDELNAGRSVRDVAATLASGLGLPRKSVYEKAVEELRKLNRE
jgi:16S rRNA (cytidine1402-2'-O)-methyltransferase